MNASRRRLTTSSIRFDDIFFISMRIRFARETTHRLFVRELKAYRGGCLVRAHSIMSSRPSFLCRFLPILYHFMNVRPAGHLLTDWFVISACYWPHGIRSFVQLQQFLIYVAAAAIWSSQENKQYGAIRGCPGRMCISLMEWWMRWRGSIWVRAVWECPFAENKCARSTNRILMRFRRPSNIPNLLLIFLFLSLQQHSYFGYFSISPLSIHQIIYFCSFNVARSRQSSLRVTIFIW
jgi:hypothetical protein